MWFASECSTTQHCSGNSPPFPHEARGNQKPRQGIRDAASRRKSGHEVEAPHPERAGRDARHRREAKHEDRHEQHLRPHLLRGLAASFGKARQHARVEDLPQRVGDLHQDVVVPPRRVVVAEGVLEPEPAVLLVFLIIGVIILIFFGESQGGKCDFLQKSSRGAPANPPERPESNGIKTAFTD